MEKTPQKQRLAFVVLGGMLVLAIAFSIVNIVRGTTPNPGHPWTDLGDGMFIVSSTLTSPHTFIFPNATSTVLTDNAAVTVAQGGTGATSFTSGLVLQGNGTGALSAIATGTVNNVLTATSTGWISAPAGIAFLGSKVISGSTAATTGALTITAYDQLMIFIRVTGYTNTDVASLRFNGDSGSNYWDRHITWATGGTTPTDLECGNGTNGCGTAGNRTLMRLGGNLVTTGRDIMVLCSNFASVSKSCKIMTQTGTGAAATTGVLDDGGGEWVNTSNQITSVELLVAGSRQFNVGTGFAVYGRNF